MGSVDVCKSKVGFIEGRVPKTLISKKWRFITKIIKSTDFLPDIWKFWSSKKPVIYILNNRILKGIDKKACAKQVKGLCDSFV